MQCLVDLDFVDEAETYLKAFKKIYPEGAEARVSGTLESDLEKKKAKKAENGRNENGKSKTLEE